MHDLLCPWEPASYLFFSSNVPLLVHYSHAVAVIAACAIALYVFASNPRDLVARLFMGMVILFSAWTILDVMLWATNRPDIVMWAWSLQILLEPLTYVAAFYLYFTYLHGRLPSLRVNAAVALLILPVLLFLPTDWNLSVIHLSDCEAIEGPLAGYYTHFVHALLILSIALMAAHAIPRLADGRTRSIALFFGLGLISFLLAFSSGTIIGSITDDWVLSQYGLFGMPVFAACIAYCIGRYRAFNAQALTAELLVVSLGIGVVSLLTLQDIPSVRMVAGITFVLVCIVGYVLVRNVKREVAQRIQIEKQERELELANKQQESLLHFISHEVKGFLSEGQNAFAAIVEGDFGEAPPKVKGLSQTALTKMRHGVSTVMDILDASNLKKGSITYAKTTFDIGRVIESAIDNLRERAATKRISISYDTAPGEHVYVGDAAKIERHVIRNLIDNAIRYTPSGSIAISLRRENTHYRIEISDTGVGITAEDMANLFTEGGHGKESIKVNVDSTGFGLYVAKQVVVAHQGRIWAESEGKGKGSRFIVELPFTSP